MLGALTLASIGTNAEIAHNFLCNAGIGYLILPGPDQIG